MGVWLWDTALCLLVAKEAEEEEEEEEGLLGF